jgi:hypothetical protein
MLPLSCTRRQQQNTAAHVRAHTAASNAPARCSLAAAARTGSCWPAPNTAASAASMCSGATRRARSSWVFGARACSCMGASAHMCGRAAHVLVRQGPATAARRHFHTDTQTQRHTDTETHRHTDTRNSDTSSAMRHQATHVGDLWGRLCLVAPGVVGIQLSKARIVLHALQVWLCRRVCRAKRVHHVCVCVCVLREA